MGKAGDQGVAVVALELVEVGVVDDAADHFAHIKRFFEIGTHDTVELAGIEARGLGLLHLELAALLPVEARDAGAGELQGVGVILGVVVGHTALLGVNIGAAQVFGTDGFSGGGLHQRRASQEDGALFAHDDRFIGHGRHIGTAGGAGAHDHGDLRNTLGGEGGLVVEDTAKVVPVGEHFILAGQEGAAGIDQVDARQAMLAGDFLGAQVLLDREWIVGAALDGGVVGDDHALHPRDATDAGDHAGCGHMAFIDLMGGQGREFKEGRALVKQVVDTVAHEQLATALVAGAGLFAAALGDGGGEFTQLHHLVTHRLVVGLEAFAARIDLCR